MDYFTISVIGGMAFVLAVLGVLFLMDRKSPPEPARKS